jgi:hypothetical protein
MPLNTLAKKGFVPLLLNTNVCIDSKKNIYFNNDKGVFKSDGNSVNKVSNNPIFENKLIRNFYIDKKDNVYFITIDNSGFTEIYQNNNDNVTKLPPFFKNFPSLIKFDSNNNLFLQVDNTFVTYDKDNKATLHVDNNIYKLNGQTWELFFKLDVGAFSNFTIDEKDNIWWTDYFNIYKIDSNKKVTTYFGGKDIQKGIYKSIAIDKKGIVWVLTEINNKIVLLKYQNNTWNNIDIENELPLPLQFINDYTGMGIDKQNRVWIFSNSFGTYIYDDSGQVKSQTISAEKITSQKNIAQSFKIIANTSSNLPLSYKLISGPAKIQKDSIILTGEIGKVILQISQSGNEIYEAAKNVELSFEVTIKAIQNIAFNKIEQKTLADKVFTLNATSTSGLPITYQIISGSATLNGNTITLTGTGKVIIRAKQEGNDNFLAANEVNQEFCIIPAKPQITADATNNWQLKVNADKNIQWYFEGKKIANATQPSLLATENGKYQVEIANSDASCASNISDVFQLLILATENELNQLIKVYPNPADDWVTIDAETPLKITEIKLYDMKGGLLYSKDKVETPFQIKIQHVWKGNAFLEIKTKDKTYIKKLILL